ncbi:MAG: hypothetical protein MJE66_19700 [Proteobacteria bacterium]|nr:hypothetical protein [Pseudomonadota bacterium]
MRAALGPAVAAVALLAATTTAAVVVAADRARAAVEAAVAVGLGLPVTTGGSRFDPLRGEIEVWDLHVANPAGFSDADLIAVESVRLRVRPSWGGLETTGLRLQGVRLSLERSGGSVNAIALAHQLREADLPAVASGPDEAARLRVKRVRLLDVHAEIQPGDGAAILLPEVLFRQPRSDRLRGTSRPLLVRRLFEAVIEAVAVRARSLPDDIGDALRDEARPAVPSRARSPWRHPSFPPTRT